MALLPEGILLAGTFVRGIGPVPFGRAERFELPRDLLESRGGGGAAGGAGGGDGTDDLEGEFEGTGGVGGGGAAGDRGPLPKAFRAACIARDCCESGPKECELGRLDVIARAAGGFGAEEGGGGGTEGGVGAGAIGGRGTDDGAGGEAEGGVAAIEGVRGGGGGAAEGLREATGGGGGLADPDRGGGGLGGVTSALELGLWRGFGGGLRRFATRGLAGGLVGWGADDSAVCGFGRSALILGAVGGLGADDHGGLGTEGRDVSGSDA